MTQCYCHPIAKDCPACFGAERYVKNEVLACQTSLIDDMLCEPFMDNDEIVNLFEPCCPDCGETVAYQDDETVVNCPGCRMTMLPDDVEREPQEIFEWWLVSQWLADNLKAIGEPVLDNDYGTWWGRTVTGQSMELDGTLQSLWRSVEIRNQSDFARRCAERGLESLDIKP